MMLLLFMNTLRGHRFALLLMGLLIAGLGILLPTSFSSFGDAGSLLENLPEAYKALLKAEGNALAELGARGYIAIGFLHPLYLIMVSAFAIGSASGAVAGEIERKTILLLLGRPLARYQFLLSKGAESVFGIFLLVAALLAGAYVGIFLAGLQSALNIQPFISMSFNAFCLFLAIMGYSYLFSAVSSDWGKATSISAGLTLGFFFLDYLTSLFDVMEPLGIISVFHYYDPVGTAVSGGFPSKSVAILLIIAVCTVSLAMALFQRRDIAT